MNDAKRWHFSQGIGLALSRGLLAAAASLASLPAGGWIGNEVFTVTVSLTGTGSGRVVSQEGAYIDCPGNCTTGYLVGNWLTLNATPAPGSFLASWSGECNGNLSSVCRLFVARDLQVGVTFSLEGVDLAVSQTSSPAYRATGKDVTYAINVVSIGTETATGVTLTDTIPATTDFVWASPGCSQAAGTVTCPIGSLASGARASVKVVVRPTAATSITNTASVSGTPIETDYTNNTQSITNPVSASPPGVATLRYRLYSPVTLEHHFTTDLNEYTVLGGYVGTWVQEGTVGSVLNNPGSFNGVTAVPYYRLYDTSVRWHHWTTDANEYYTLIEFPWWTGEGVDGYVLPTTTAGATQLYRLLYPFIPGLHHWTIDPTEYGILTSTYGWIGEGGSDFVIP